MGNVCRRLLQQSGTSSIETACAMLVAVPFAFIAFELCMYAYTQAVLSDSARMGVRYAIVHGTDSSNCSGPSTGCGDTAATNVASAVRTYSSNFLKNLTRVNVTVSYPDASSAPPSRVKVTLSYTYAPLVSTSFGSQTMRATSEGRIVF